MAEVGDVDCFHPTTRIKALSEQASSVSIDIRIPAKRYFRSSLEMTRMAKVYFAEDNLESAFVLYQKYLWFVFYFIFFLCSNLADLRIILSKFHSGKLVELSCPADNSAF